MIIVRNGKGDKDRGVMLPKSSIPFLHHQIAYAQSRYNEDILNNAPAVMVPEALDHKYPGLGKKWGWFLLFPSGDYSTKPSSGIVRRHHIHPATVQKAISYIRKRCNIIIHATPHVFRHFFAIHLLENGTDINTVQRLMGYKDIRTTMVYLHVLESRSDKVLSPADTIESFISSNIEGCDKKNIETCEKEAKIVKANSTPATPHFIK